MLRLYGFSKVNAFARGHTRDLRVLWAIEEMQLPFQLAGMDHPAHDLSTEAYRRLSPFEQIPAIDDDGVELSESAAIVLYLANKCGRLIPADAAGEAQVLRSGIHDAALLAPYPGVAAYRDRCLARPAWLRVAQAFEQRVVAG